jgi:UDP-N-acetylmuramyl tripeptide synthase
MELLDSRRLTGPNLLWDKPGAVLDVRFGKDRSDALIEAWKRQAREILDALGWRGETLCVRRFPEGASLALSAPMDVLYAATEINEWAWDRAYTLISGGETPDLREDAAKLKGIVNDESNPRLRALLEAAAGRGLPALSDDDCLSLGLGKGSRSWPVDELPSPYDVPWSDLHAIPVGVITGTNGKTTSVRLSAAVGRAAGRVVGLSSTDWIAVDDEILDRGDYSGPGGARAVLRDRRVELAVLETARGGLLRRGLALTRVDAALITNVAADHLGELGVETVEQLADVKWVVTRALAGGGRLVLNAEDPLLVARARNYRGPITWFGLDPQSAVLRAGLERPGGTACTLVDGRMIYLHKRRSDGVVAVADVPICLGGSATYNIRNALGVIGLMAALGIPLEKIATGLRSMRPEDNPGRANLYHIGGARVIADFAHNPHGMQALLELGRNLPARRRLLVTGQAGDRTDSDIRDLVRAAAGIDLDRVIIKRMSKYRRGREDGEVSAMMRDELLRLGLDPHQVQQCDEEMEAVVSAVEWAQPGDLVLLSIHEDRESALAYLDSRQEQRPAGILD